MLYLQSTLAEMCPIMLFDLLLSELLNQLLELIVEIIMLNLTNIVFEAHTREVELRVAFDLLIIDCALIFVSLIPISIGSVLISSF